LKSELADLCDLFWQSISLVEVMNMVISTFYSNLFHFIPFCSNLFLTFLLIFFFSKKKKLENYVDDETIEILFQDSHNKSQDQINKKFGKQKYFTSMNVNQNHWVGLLIDTKDVSCLSFTFFQKKRKLKINKKKFFFQ